MRPPEYGSDRYVWQLQRQNMGLTCSDCGSSQGHFGFCPLFHKGLPMDKPQPDSQSFYRRAQQEVRAQAYIDGYEAWENRRNTKQELSKPVEFNPTEADVIIAHALGVKL